MPTANIKVHGGDSVNHSAERTEDSVNGQTRLGHLQHGNVVVGLPANGQTNNAQRKAAGGQGLQ